MSKDKLSLKFIASWVKNGFTSGYYPGWELSFDKFNYNDLDVPSLENIAQKITDGFIQGEIIVYKKNFNKNGWWEIKFY
jgi:hypothetical protein